MKRKDFIKKAGLVLITAPSLLQSCKKGNKEITVKDDNLQPHCGATDSATEGPFFVQNTAETVNLNSLNLSGTPMNLSGKIYDKTTGNPIVDAKVEIWHADNAGVYHPEGDGDIKKYPANQVTLRGFVISNANGDYSVRSIKPGLYTGRRRHIHCKITVLGYLTLTTQSYWLDEKGTVREREDQTDTNTETCRYVDFKSDGNNGITGTFDIYLEKI